MAKKKMTLINRDEYNRIRKMDHASMTTYLRGVWQEGFQKGAKSAEGLTDEELWSILVQIKGVGEKKVEAIVSAVREATDKKQLKGA